MPWTHTWFAIVLGLAFTATARAQADVVIAPVRAWSNVFGNTEVEFRFRVESKKDVRGRVAWNYKVGLATVVARDVEIVAMNNKPAEFAVKFPVPPVKDGVILTSKLRLAFLEGNEPMPIAEHAMDIEIFPTDPFVDRVEWLKGLKLRVYDPQQNTVKALTSLNVPFEELTNAASLVDLTDGLLIIGEGTAFKNEPGLSETLANRAEVGVKILCLAPSDGSLIVPGLGKAAGWKTLTFIRDRIVTLDKRFDSKRWAPDGTLPSVSLAVKSESLVEPAHDGWPWIEARPVQGSGRWAVCGYPIVARWADGPTPRFVLTRILEHLTDSHPLAEKK